MAGEEFLHVSPTLHDTTTPFQNFLKPSFLRQKKENDLRYFKAKNERAQIVEELVLQKKFFPW